jgi:hypothetical protein
MRLQGMIKSTVLGGVALVVVQAGSSVAMAQCPSCGNSHGVAASPVVQGIGVPGIGVPGIGLPGLSAMHQMRATAAATHPGNTVAYGNVLGQGTQPLFENYFTQGNANQATAGMYISPIGVPGHVGHTYYTYQPFYPHHYLYQHHDRYHSYYDGGRGLNRTHATYMAPPVRSSVHWLHKSIQLPHR